MFDKIWQSLGNWPARRWLIVGLVGAGLGITMVVLLSNQQSAQAGTCAANPEARAAINAVAKGELAALHATASGRSYADLAFTDETGRPMTLDDFAGKPLLVNFWATWCGPCRKEMPELDALAGRFGGDDFGVVTIDLDIGAGGVDKARAFLDESGLGNLTLYADASFAAFDRLKTEGVALGLPATLLVDAKGCEIAVLQGPAAWDSADAHAVIEVLMALPGN